VSLTSAQQGMPPCAAAYALAGKKDDAVRERAEFLRLKQLADATMGK
jgi:hypothetical protein